MTDETVVALFGLSGVGKSRLARQLCERRPEVMHLEASALMRTALRTSSEILRTASAHAMADNQRSLIDSFTAARAVARFRPVLFDGHTLIDNDAGLVEIPLTVIAALRIRHIVFVSEDVSIILERRRVDTRKRPSRTLNELTHHQDLARSIARTHADSLAIPFYEIQSGDLASLIVLFEQASRGR